MTSTELDNIRAEMDAILVAAAGEGQLDEQFGQLLSLQVRKKKRDPLARFFSAAVLTQHPAPHPLFFFPPKDADNPDFVAEVATLYFTDSADKLDRLLARLGGGSGDPAAGTAPPPPPWAEVDGAIHQFKGASASFGAAAVVGGCVRAREACAVGDGAAVAALLAGTRDAFNALRGRMEAYLALDARRKALERGR